MQQFVGTVQDGYEKLVSAVIRPPRAIYTEEDLGPKRFLFAGRLHHRIDFEVFSVRPGDSPPLLKCSHWRPEPKEDQEPIPRPVVIFLHGNASCRTESGGVLHTVLSSSADLVAFDFGGSGMSHGEYVSLGYFEKDDLHAVITYLRKYNMATSIGLWGRSMGAVTALLHARREPSIAGLVLDSPFSEFRVLAGELCEKETFGAVPEWLADAALAVIKVSIKKRAGFDVDELNPLKYVWEMQIPALFAAADDDDFIYPYHSRVLEEAYGGESTLLSLEGDHNSERGVEFANDVRRFLMKHLFSGSENSCTLNKIVSGTSRNNESKGDAKGYPQASPRLEEEGGFVTIPQPLPSPNRGSDGDHSPQGDGGYGGTRQKSPRPKARPAPADPEEYTASRDKGTIKSQLLALGFSGALVDAAMKRNSTLESCVEWMVINPDGTTQTLGVE